MGVLFGLMPRSTHIKVQPRTHVMLVGPTGASTINSKFGCVVCAFAIAQPRPRNARAAVVERTIRTIEHLLQTGRESSSVTRGRSRLLPRRRPLFYDCDIEPRFQNTH